MSNSSLISCTDISPNKTSPRTHAIDRITPHCVVGQASAERIGEIFEKASKKASCNYGIGSDGRVVLVVDEADRSWCSSSSANDHRAVTIECASDTTDPYAMTDAVYASLINLCVDICKRNGKTKLLWLEEKAKTLAYTPADDEMVLTVHRWFKNKACPGDWLYSRLGDLAAQVTALLGGQSAAESTTESTAEAFASYKVRVKVRDLNIRKSASVDAAATGYTGKGVFTIVEEANGKIDQKGNTGTWGLLKSHEKKRDGWICLAYEKYTEKI